MPAVDNNNLFSHLRRYPTYSLHRVSNSCGLKLARHRTCSQVPQLVFLLELTSQVEAAWFQSNKLYSCVFQPLPHMKKKSKGSNNITDAITYCLAKDSFKKLIKVLDPRYVLPGRKHFSQTALPQLYDKCRRKLQMNLTEAKYFATTTDLWSSRTSEPYISLTVHFIDDKWALHSKCLQTEPC